LGAYALSPHGKYLIYSINYDRIHIRSIESGKEYDFPAPSRFSTDDIVFSKNSETVTYNSGGSIYIANFPDFTTKQVIKNPGFLAPVGWLSENQNLLAIGYVEKAGGGYLYTIDLLSGQIQKSSAIKDIVGFVMLAPNKQQILFRDNIIDSTSRGVFISNLDGTGHRLLLYYDALDDLNDLNSLAWSQDGKWVLISLYGSNNSYINLLVNPVTCESYRLDVTDWAIDQWIN
jgi:hypothetical protein